MKRSLSTKVKNKSSIINHKQMQSNECEQGLSPSSQALYIPPIHSYAHPPTHRPIDIMEHGCPGGGAAVGNVWETLAWSNRRKSAQSVCEFFPSRWQFCDFMLFGIGGVSI